MNMPTFSSFPPSFGSFRDADEIDKRTGSSKLRQKDDRRSTREDHDRPRKRTRDRDDSGSKARKEKRKEKRHKYDRYDDERGKHEEDRHFGRGESYEDGVPRLFVVDKYGDQMNVTYGGLHVADIPKYRRAGYGRILGLSPSLRIITRGIGGKALEVGVGGKRPPVRYIESRSFALLTTSRTRQLLPSSSSREKGRANPAVEGDISPSPDFIRLPSRRGRPDTDPLSTYRSILPEDSDSDSVTSSDSEDIAASESDVEDNMARTALQHSLASVEASLQKNPTSLPLWFALVELTLSTIPPSSNTSLTRARADTKLSVLDRAMKTDKKNKNSVELRLEWLSAGADIWDAEKLDKEWEQAVRELGMRDNNDQTEQLEFTRNDIWEAWLRWRISSARRGTEGQTSVEGIIQDGRRVLAVAEGELTMVKILWRIAVVLQEAGFSERAMALFQAQMELTFNCPPSLASSPFSVRLEALEEFWDAEVPRVGEIDAHGWQSWVHKGRPDTRPSAPFAQYNASNTNLDDSLDPYVRWAIDEAVLDSISAMPKRTDDVGDDPYVATLFSDIKDLLLDITSVEAKHALRLAWLGYIGLYIPGFVKSLGRNTNAHDDVWAHRHLSRSPYLEALFPPGHIRGNKPDWIAVSGTIIAREKTYGQPFSCVKEWGRGVFEPLENIGETTVLWQEKDLQAVDKDLVRRIFEQLRCRTNSLEHDEEWDMMATAFEALHSIKSAIKLSRTILSNSRESLPLWGAHARLERMRGKMDEARRVYETALSNTSGSFQLHRGEAALWWAWAEMEWLQGNDDRARITVLRAVGVTADGPLNVLKGKRALEERLRSPSEWKEREAWTCLLALLEVLAGGSGAIEEGMRVLQRYVAVEGLQGIQRESAWTRMLLLEWKHAVLLRRQTKRSVVRNIVREVVREIEESGSMNSAILGVFLEGEKGESVWGRVRALVGESGLTVGKEDGLTFKTPKRGVPRRIWELWLANWESGRWAEEKERVRNSLGIAVNDERTRASAIIWRIYLEFEIYCGELKKAKKLLFRAVADCPLVKELYLLAFRALRSIFTAEELEALAETMAERGIRIHRGLEEYIVTDEGNIKHDSDGGSDSHSEAELELEKEARDYRRLAPF